jgi:hypothetical protein
MFSNSFSVGSELLKSTSTARKAEGLDDMLCSIAITALNADQRFRTAASG